VKEYLVLYLIPAAVVEEWSKTDPDKKKAAEDKMRAEWGEWMRKHAKIINDTRACGKTKRVTAGGTSDTKNDIHLYSIVVAESQAEAAKLFESHPHLQIPQSSIEVMEIRSLGGT
jgi:U3 small nucleolar RNA-associated protein 14